MTKHRAYSFLEIKAVAGPTAKRRFTGIATTPTADRTGDIVEPKGAEFKLPIPLCWMHNTREPVGWVTAAKVTDKGIEIDGEIADIAEPASLKDRLDTAWSMLVNKLVQGLSIGFKPLESSRIGDTYSYRYTKWLWLELSPVTVPANGDCSIESIKSIDSQVLKAAPGFTRDVVRLGAPGALPTRVPGATGQTPANPGTINIKGTADMKTIAEQILEFQKKRADALTRKAAIVQKAVDDGRSLDESEDEENTNLAQEIVTIDKHIATLKEHEAFMVANATPVTPAVVNKGDEGVHLRGGVLSVRRNVEKGSSFTRYCAALALTKGNAHAASEFAKKWDDTTPEVSAILKAAVAAGSTSDTTWAGPLVQYQDMASEFISLLRPRTILGRMTGVRRVPFNIRIGRQTAGITGQFVGEGSPSPVNKLAFDNVTLPWAKASCIVVLNNELVRMANPSAEALVREDLLSGIAQYLDKRLVDPSFAGVANVSPASLTHGVTAVASSGVTLAAITTDAEAALDKFDQAEMEGSLTWIYARKTARRLSMFRNTNDEFAFPTVTPEGGSFFGYPTIVSNNVEAAGSPTDRHVLVADQSEILLADDGEMMVDASSEASLQMNDAPSAGAQSLVSLWQNGMVGLKIDRWIYWTKRRSQAVQIIDNVNW